MYENGVKFKEVIAVAIGILAFSFFIWKTARFLSKREPITLKRISSISVENLSERKRIVDKIEITSTLIYKLLP